MQAQAIRVIGVIGAGQMGAGIAQVMAQSGLSVVVQDIGQPYLENGLNSIRQSLDRLVKKGKMGEDQKRETLGRLRTTLDLAEMRTAQVVIEAATENVRVKEEIFRKLDEITPAATILATNTSSISITHIGAATARPDRVIGMHFMNPVPLMELVEIIRGLRTSEETFQCIQALTRKVAKTPVEAQDFPGFIVNRILMPMINEAVYALYEGVGKPADIDAAMRLGTNQPMGPLTLADLIGLDTCLAIMEVLHTGLGDSKYRPCPLLKKYVEAGYLGRKVKRGFYTYE
ncbi:MAG: 3-hydroxybutyryl-CoA dehydrogenase [bacterium]